LTIRQDVPKVWHLLGIAARAAGRKEDALEMFQKALSFFPDSPNVLSDLSFALLELNRFDEALPFIEKVKKLQPKGAEGALAFGKYLIHKKRLPEAEAELSRAISLNPKLFEAHLRYGNAVRDQGRLEEAAGAFRKALQINPSYVDGYINFGALLWSLGKSADAVQQYQRAIEINPQSFQARNNLGVALSDLGRHDEAIVQFKACLQINPQHAKAHNNLANALRNIGALDEALIAFDRATDLAPENATFLSNAVFSHNFSPQNDAQKRFAIARKWGERFADGLLATIPPHTNTRDPQRRLKIGYVSPDFCNHVVTMFFVPLAANHRPEQVEITCYSNVIANDALTMKLKELIPRWHNISALDDDAAAQKIREDKIDILVDLALHTAGNRLGVFARKPAPVQVCYLGTIGSTGLKQMDYRLTDRFLDPPDRIEDCYCEKTIRLPDACWCFDPLATPPPVTAAPVLSKGYITFGCQAAFMKFNDPLVSLWAAVLKAIPQSRMIVRADSGPQQQRLAAWFAKHGVGRERVEFVSTVGRLEFLKRHEQIDIALDTFPYSGVTTSLDAYLMGVPVLSLCGRDALSRAGLSLAASLGLAEVLVATSPTQFVEKAIALASNPQKLNGLRQQLRAQFAKSPLADAPRFTQNLEQAYRQMWQTWCSQGR
jgi:predicted O-linked N-acetylglucosamine transferase (SPINDLY family)